MIALFFGPDTYGLDAEVDKIQKKAGTELKVVQADGIRDFIANLSSTSFFSEKRVFVAQEITGGMSEKQTEHLKEALEKIDPDTDVLFVERSKPKSIKFVNIIKKLGEVKEFASTKNPNLVGFIKKQVEEESGSIAPLAAERLAGFVGPDMWQLTEEVKKLVLYKASAGENKEIQTADVELLTHANFEATIFELTDAIAAKNQRKAANLINDFLKDGENEIYLLTMIERQFRNIAMAKFEPGATPDIIAKAAGIHPYVAQKSIQQAHNFERTELINMYKRLEDADFKLKSGANPAQTLLRLIA
jgi:DNA polymerase III subunit delta